MADILDEVESDYRADQLRAAARRYAWVAALVLIAALAAAAGWQGWQAHRARTSLVAATAYTTIAAAADALVAGDTPGRLAAAQRFETFAATAPDGYRALARLRAAALLADANHLPDAQTVWDRVASDPGADPMLRQLASLLWVQRSLDSADPAALRTRLVSVTEATNPYRALGLECQALLDLRLHQAGPARDLLRRLAADPTSPEGVRARAGALLARLG